MTDEVKSADADLLWVDDADPKLKKVGPMLVEYEGTTRQISRISFSFDEQRKKTNRLGLSRPLEENEIEEANKHFDRIALNIFRSNLWRHVVRTIAKGKGRKVCGFCGKSMRANDAEFVSVPVDDAPQEAREAFKNGVPVHKKCAKHPPVDDVINGFWDSIGSKKPVAD